MELELEVDVVHAYHRYARRHLYAVTGVTRRLPVRSVQPIEHMLCSCGCPDGNSAEIAPHEGQNLDERKRFRVLHELYDLLLFQPPIPVQFHKSLLRRAYARRIRMRPPVKKVSRWISALKGPSETSNLPPSNASFISLSLSLSLRLIEAQIGVMLPRNPVIVANEAQKAPIAQKNTKHYEVRVP